MAGSWCKPNGHGAKGLSRPAVLEAWSGLISLANRGAEEGETIRDHQGQNAKRASPVLARDSSRPEPLPGAPKRAAATRTGGERRLAALKRPPLPPDPHFPRTAIDPAVRTPPTSLLRSALFAGERCPNSSPRCITSASPSASDEMPRTPAHAQFTATFPAGQGPFLLPLWFRRYTAPHRASAVHRPISSSGTCSLCNG